jgi:GTPase SAR1 family protein
VEDVSDHPVIRRGLPAGTRSQDIERVLMVLVANKCDLEFERQIGIDGLFLCRAGVC